MEHNMAISTEQIQFLLDILDSNTDFIEEDVEVGYNDFGVQELLEDAIEESWFNPGGFIYDTCKKNGTL